MLHRLQDRLLGDLMKHDAVIFVHIEPQHGRQMPCDGLSFPVRVARQIDVIALLGQLLEILDDLFFISADLVIGNKAVFDIDAQTALAGGRKVTDMSLAGDDMIVAAKVFLDRLRF